jgi:hypothetical protein
MWKCVADPIGDPDTNNTSYLYTTGTADHVVGFSAPAGTAISGITSVTLHIVAGSYNNDAGTVTMTFYNNGSLAGTGSTKTIAAGSDYTEYVSGVFSTSISDISNLTMKASFTGDVEYTAMWIDVTYGGAGTNYADVETYMVNSHSDTYSNGWISRSCSSATGCGGGNGNGALTVTPNTTSPSRNGDTSATKVAFNASTPESGTASALESVRRDHSSPYTIPIVASLTGNWWFYVNSADTSNLRSLEFDQFWADTGDSKTGDDLAMWGTHCNFTEGYWELDAQDGTSPGWRAAIDAQTGQPIPCNTTILPQNTWHQITWLVHHDPTANKIYYDYLIIDGTTHIIAYESKAHGYNTSKNPPWNTLGIQVQQDLNNSSAAKVTEYVDAMSITYW